MNHARRVTTYSSRRGPRPSGYIFSQSRRLAAKNLELTQITPVPDWLTVEKEQFSGKVSRIPTREEIAPIVNEQLIVELYSR